MSDPRIDEAGRRLAVTLMRLNEALEMRDAQDYSSESSMSVRVGWLRAFYRDWFKRRATEER